MLITQFPKKNNLEWLRLIFAWQVVFVHTSEHLKMPIPSLLHHFPGVPAFFFVSGFLIYISYLNAPGRPYYENRFLRLFPGLLMVTIGGAIIVLIAHGFADIKTYPLQYITWIIAQVTLGQAYNPSLFRDVGVGVMNGSLWSITTEILFYLTVPLIVYLERRVRHVVLLLFVLSFSIYSFGPNLFTSKVYREKTVYDLIELTPIVWGWMFGCGILVAKYFNNFKKYIKYLPLLVFPLVGMIFFGSGVVFESKGNHVGIVYFFTYAGLIIWLAFGTPYVRLPVDLSYGTYIWHMPVINFLIVMAIPNIILAFVLIITLAIASWFFVEKPALKFKRKSIHYNV